MIRKLSFSTLFFTLAGSLLFLGACGSGHDHYSAIGVVLSVDGQMIAAQEQENITYATGDAISIPVGSTTETISVQFLGDDGTPFTPERSGYSLRHTIGNSDVLGITHPAAGGEWSFRLTGNQVGTTTIQFDLWHGGHSDFTSRAFQVRVEDSEND
ncbi:MAG: hypothetical protein EA363_07925 [Balneolaceae bacterium]|nr:MAG: hypothetical protein EA363_07925 [Balneolaceae bacterium]